MRNLTLDELEEIEHHVVEIFNNTGISVESNGILYGSGDVTVYLTAVKDKDVRLSVKFPANKDYVKALA